MLIRNNNAAIESSTASEPSLKNPTKAATNKMNPRTFEQFAEEKIIMHSVDNNFSDFFVEELDESKSSRAGGLNAIAPCRLRTSRYVGNAHTSTKSNTVIESVEQF